jgi:hypothetical protein
MIFGSAPLPFIVAAMIVSGVGLTSRLLVTWFVKHKHHDLWLRLGSPRYPVGFRAHPRLPLTWELRHEPSAQEVASANAALRVSLRIYEGTYALCAIGAVAIIAFWLLNVVAHR